MLLFTCDSYKSYDLYKDGELVDEGNKYRRDCKRTTVKIYGTKSVLHREAPNAKTGQLSESPYKTKE